MEKYNIEKYNMKILALIPARGGSKGIKNKNIKLFKEKPLIYWSINIAKKCKYINRIICSTDSEVIASIAKQSGAEVPFLRPKEISDDLSTDLEFTEHCLNYLKEKENYKPDIIVHLRPTYPTRKLKILNETIDIFIKNINNYDSLRTVIKFEKSPFKMYTVNNNKLIPLFKSISINTNNTNNTNNNNNNTNNNKDNNNKDNNNNNKTDNKIDNIIYEPYNRCRQELPETYLHNGYIDIIKYNTITVKKSVTGDNIYPYLMDKNEYHDIDTTEDWIKAENTLI